MNQKLILLSPYLENVLRNMVVGKANFINDADRIILMHYGFVEQQEGAGCLVTSLGLQYLKNIQHSLPMPTNISFI